MAVCESDIKSSSLHNDPGRGRGELDWGKVPQLLLSIAQRIQINTHAEEHISKFDMISNLRQVQPGKTFIFQWDGVNDHLAYAAKDFVNTEVLFDSSHGAGVLSKLWPKSKSAFECGYAGGLSPENVLEENEKIAKAADGIAYWIDMEGKVRSDNGKILDLDKVRTVLKLMKPFAMPWLKTELV